MKIKVGDYYQAKPDWIRERTFNLLNREDNKCVATLYNPIFIAVKRVARHLYQFKWIQGKVIVHISTKVIQKGLERIPKLKARMLYGD